MSPTAYRLETAVAVLCVAMAAITSDRLSSCWWDSLPDLNAQVVSDGPDCHLGMKPDCQTASTMLPRCCTASGLTIANVLQGVTRYHQAEKSD